MTMIPLDWLPSVPMQRIHWHWTAGNTSPSALDRQHYHLLVDTDGRWHKGRPGIELNSGSLRPGYAAHTRSANSNAIGIACCGMAGAREVPFDAGRAPLTEAQIQSLIAGTAEVALRYRIAPSRRTMLSHAEVQRTLGIAQRAKWDIARLPHMPELKGAHAVGDWLRDAVRQRMGGVAPARDPVPPPDGPMVGGYGYVAVDRAPTTSRIDTVVSGALPRGTRVEILHEHHAGRLQVRTPAGYQVWVDAGAIVLEDVAPPKEPSQPSPARLAIERARAALDDLESAL